MTTEKKYGLFTALRVVCAVLLCVSLCGTYLTAFLRTSVFDRERYVNEETAKKYAAELKKGIDEGLDYQCTVCGFPTEDILASVSEESLYGVSKEYLGAFLDSLVSGKTMPQFHVDLTGAARVIEKYRVGAAENDLFSSEENCAAFLQILSTEADNQLNCFAYSSYLTKITPYLSETGTLAKTASLFPLFLVLAVLSAAGIMLLPGKDWIGRGYLVSLLLFCTNTLFFLPVTLIDWFDVPSSIALGEGALKGLFRTLWERLLGRNLRFLSWMEIGTLAAVLACAGVFVYLSVRQSKGKKQKKQTV